MKRVFLIITLLTMNLTAFAKSNNGVNEIVELSIAKVELYSERQIEGVMNLKETTLLISAEIDRLTILSMSENIDLESYISKLSKWNKLLENNQIDIKEFLILIQSQRDLIHLRRLSNQ